MMTLPANAPGLEGFTLAPGAYAEVIVVSCESCQWWHAYPGDELSELASIARNHREHCVP
jgi:hypothetical protein